jgi:DNA-binding PadR family transcriptional regulator
LNIRTRKFFIPLNYHNLAKREKAYLLKPLKRGMDEEQILEDLVLLLLYVYSWKEKVTDDLFVIRSWKGYNFGTLDSLAMKGYISSSHRAKSVIITEEGLERAKRLKEKLLKAIGKLYGSD